MVSCHDVVACRDMTTCYDPMTWYAMITCRDVVTCRHVLACRDMPVCLHTMTRPGIRSAIAYLHMLTSVDRDSSGRVGRVAGEATAAVVTFRRDHFELEGLIVT